MHFLGILYLGPQGVLRPEILYALEIDQCYLAHTPKILIAKIRNRAKPDYCVLDAITSRLVGVSLRDFLSRRPARLG